MIDKIDYTVSIRLMTFNHEDYIADSINGILIQKTNFKVEVVVGDDFSIDKTLEIIKKYNDRENIHFNILKRSVGDEYWKKRQKIGRIFNFTNILENCHGKYIAILDGDDYWTDPLKLQKQVDFLESHPDYALVHTDLDILHQKLNKIIKSHYKNINLNIPTGEVFNELLIKNTISTLTVMFRNSIIKDILKNESEIFSFGMGDYPLWLEISQKSKIGFIDESTVMYRKLEVSESHNPNVDSMYKLRLNIFKVRFYFIKKYGCDKKVEKKIDKNLNIFNLNYGFNTRNNEIIKKNYLRLKETNEDNFDSKLKYYSAKSKLNWNLIKFYFKVKNKIERLKK